MHLQRAAPAAGVLPQPGEDGEPLDDQPAPAPAPRDAVLPSNRRD